MSLTTTPTPRHTSRTGRQDRHAVRMSAAAAAALLIANGAVSLFGGDLTDHTRGPGMATEILTGLSFLAGAAALASAARVHGWRAWLWWLAPLGMTIAGLTMVGVPLAGAEPPTWLFIAGALPTFIGQVAVGVLGIPNRWPWWTGVGVALLMPIMFLAPFNTAFMTIVWIAVALTIREQTQHRLA